MLIEVVFPLYSSGAIMYKSVAKERLHLKPVVVDVNSKFPLAFSWDNAQAWEPG
jgi:hypothetical protein